VSGREVTVQLGKRSTLMPQQDSLALLADQTVLFDVMDPTARFTGSKEVAMCSDCAVPEAAITGPAVSVEKTADISAASSPVDQLWCVLLSYCNAPVGCTTADLR
jgi:hypothetical protein